jgi:hypothetical protein
MVAQGSQVSKAYRCKICDTKPVWVIERRGDAVVAWSCDTHLAAICAEMQRWWEDTRLIVKICKIPSIQAL